MDLHGLAALGTWNEKSVEGNFKIRYKPAVFGTILPLTYHTVRSLSNNEEVVDKRDDEPRGL